MGQGNHSREKNDSSVDPKLRGWAIICPMSPVLFAIVLDPFLRKLQHTFGDLGKIFAHADDMALVLDDWAHSVLACNTNSSCIGYALF